MTGRVLRGLLISADATKPVQLVETGTDAAAIAAALGCEWIETVRTAWLRDRRMLMVVDEEGRLTNAPLNARASMIYAADAIQGDVLLVGDDGDDLVSLVPVQIGAVAGLSFLDAVPAGGRS